MMPTRLSATVHSLLAGVLMGAMGPGMRDEHHLAVEMLELDQGDTVLDVACGPGNFTRAFARALEDDGLVVGIDASSAMLARAVHETRVENVAYVRGEAVAIELCVSHYSRLGDHGSAAGTADVDFRGDGECDMPEDRVGQSDGGVEAGVTSPHLTPTPLRFGEG